MKHWPIQEAVVLFKKLHEDAVLPAYATPGAAGMDLTTPEAFELAPGSRSLVRTGWEVAIKEGFEAQIRPRSGLALKKGVTVLNAPGTIDSDYRGELGVILVNLGTEPAAFEKGDRIAQMVVAPCCTVLENGGKVVEELPPTSRGRGGFGSTGR